MRLEDSVVPEAPEVDELTRRDEDTNFEAVESEEVDRNSEPAIYDIISYPADYPLSVIAEKWETNLIVAPGFQRRYVWKQDQASKLIESFLLNLPVPPIYLYQDSTSGNILKLIDGLQRVKSVADYYRGRFARGYDTEGDFLLTGLAAASCYLGRDYQHLLTDDQTRLNDSVLRAYIVRQIGQTGQDCIAQIFERLNTGGTLLKGQEVRNCVYHGTLNDLLVVLNQNTNWRGIFGAPQPQVHLRDVELILRFLALHHGGDYAKPMKEFMNTFMRAHRNPPEPDLASYKGLFETTCARVHNALGERPFHLTRGINAAAFDGVFRAFASNPVARVRGLSGRYETLRADNDFLRLVREATTDERTVADRLARAEEILFGRGRH